MKKKCELTSLGSCWGVKSCSSSKTGGLPLAPNEFLAVAIITFVHGLKVLGVSDLRTNKACSITSILISLEVLSISEEYLPIRKTSVGLGSNRPCEYFRHLFASSSFPFPQISLFLQSSSPYLYLFLIFVLMSGGGCRLPSFVSPRANHDFRFVVAGRSSFYDSEGRKCCI